MNKYQKAVDQMVKLFIRRFPGKFKYAKVRKDVRRLSKIENIFKSEVEHGKKR